MEELETELERLGFGVILGAHAADKTPDFDAIEATKASVPLAELIGTGQRIAIPNTFGRLSTGYSGYMATLGVSGPQEV